MHTYIHTRIGAAATMAAGAGAASAGEECVEGGAQARGQTLISAVLQVCDKLWYNFLLVKLSTSKKKIL